jgi:hypothetical protein
MPIQRQMIGILGHQHVGEQAGADVYSPSRRIGPPQPGHVQIGS